MKETDRNRGVLSQIPLLIELCDRGVLTCYRVRPDSSAVIVEHNGEQIGRYLLERNDERNGKVAFVVSGEF